MRRMENATFYTSFRIKFSICNQSDGKTETWLCVCVCVYLLYGFSSMRTHTQKVLGFEWIFDDVIFFSSPPAPRLVCIYVCILYLQCTQDVFISLILSIATRIFRYFFHLSAFSAFISSFSPTFCDFTLSHPFAAHISHTFEHDFVFVVVVVVDVWLTASKLKVIR